MTFGSLLVSSTVGITDILGSSPSLLRQWQQCQSSQLIKCYLMYIIYSSIFDQHSYLFLLVVISMVSVFLGQAGDSSCQLSFTLVSLELVLDWASAAFFFCFFHAGVASDSVYMKERYSRKASGSMLGCHKESNSTFFEAVAGFESGDFSKVFFPRQLLNLEVINTKLQSVQIIKK